MRLDIPRDTGRVTGDGERRLRATVHVFELPYPTRSRSSARHPRRWAAMGTVPRFGRAILDRVVRAGAPDPSFPKTRSSDA